MQPQTLRKLTEPAPPQTQPVDGALHGREEQVLQLEQLLRATAEEHRGHLAVLESGAGTGKTRVLLEAMSLAARYEYGVLDGVSKPLAVVHPRHGRQDGDRFNRLAAQIDDQLRRGPVLVVLDDAQWTDPAVLGALGALMSKLDDAPVLWLVALCAEYAESANGLALGTLARANRTDWLGPLEPLSGDAVVDLVGDLLDAVPDDDVVALCESVGGTPRAIVELVLELAEEGSVVVEDRVARLTSGPAGSGMSLAVAADPAARLPQPLLRFVLGRLRELSPRAQDVLQVAAVLGCGFTPRDLAEMLGERPAQLLGPLQEALAAGLVDSDGGGFAFHREPLWRAVLSTVPESLRSILHRQAATILLGRANGETVPAAVHLVHCAEIGDAEAVATIREAAELLLPGSPQAAAALATRGLRLTEPGGPDHLALGTSATSALVRLGRLNQAVELAQELLHEARHAPVESTRSLRTWLATAQMLRGDTSAEWSVSEDVAAITAGGTYPCSELLVLNTLSHNNETAMVGMADHVLASCGEYSVDVRAAALNVRAMANWREGRIDDALAAVEEAVALRGQLTDAWRCDPLWTKAWLLTKLRRLDDAWAAAQAAHRTIDSAGMGVLSPIPLALRATILLGKGEFAAAEEDATEGLTASEQTEMALYEPQLRAVLVISALRRRDVATAADRLRRLEESIPAERTLPWSVMQRVLGAYVASARRGASAVIEEIRELVEDPSSRVQLVLEDLSATAWSVRNAVAANERKLAELVVATAEEVASVNHRHESVVAAARHGRALLDGDLTALAELTEFVGRHGGPWAVASVTEDLGSLRRATDRDQAVVELNRALEIYDEVGAEWDSARVRRKLRQLGVRRRHRNPEVRPETGWGSLTGTEEKVARLVARGLTNRRVASELFISPHTVAFHLRQIYRKLSIQSRVDLARIAP